MRKKLKQANLKYVSFSSPRFISFILAFAIIGGYIIWRTFAAGTATLTLTLNGSGAIVSSPAGINCPGNCSATFPAGTNVILSSRANTGSYLSSWGNTCSGSGGPLCKVNLSANSSAIATFTPNSASVASGYNTFSSAGWTRAYRLYMPSPLPNTKRPLMVVFPGAGNPGMDNQTYTTDANWQSLGNSQGFATVILWSYANPNGTLCATTTSTGCGPRAWNFPGHDDVFVRDIIDALVAGNDIDANKVYTTGESAGATMNTSMSCGTGGVSSRIAASAFLSAGISSLNQKYVNGGQIIDKWGSLCSDPDEPRSRIYINGDQDSNVITDFPASTACKLNNNNPPDPTNGMTTCANNWDYANQWWRSQMKSCGTSTVTNPAGGTYGANKKETWNCDNSTIDEMVTVLGGGHSYGGMDGVNGMNLYQTQWNFLKNASLATLPASTIGNAQVFVASNGSDSGANCKRFTSPVANPDLSGVSLCATFGKAYQLALSGDIVEVEAGSYPAQPIHATKTGSGCDGHDSGTTVGCVWFKPAAGAAVTVSSIDLAADYVRISNMTVPNGVSFFPQVCPNTPTGGQNAKTDNIVENITANWVGIFGGYNNITVRNSSFGPLNDSASQVFPCVAPGPNGVLDNQHPYPTDILFDNDTWHDYHLTKNDGSVHMECLHIDTTGGSRGMIIRRSTFKNCGEYNISFSSVGAFNGDALVENNSLGAESGYNDVPHGPLSIANMGISAMNSGHTFIARFNSVDGSFNDGAYPNDSFSVGSVLYGNVYNSGPPSAFFCNAWTNMGLAQDYNVTTGGVPCGSHSTIVSSSPFVRDNTTDDDLHLTGCVAGSLVPLAAGLPTVDHDSNQRSNPTSPGAYECSGNAQPNPPPPPQPADTTTPSVPTNQHMVSSTTNSITMDWNASTDSGGSGLAGYKMYLNNNFVASVQSGLSYTYTSLNCGTTYTVGLTAYDNASNESDRTQASGPMSTAACNSTPPPASPPTIKGDLNADNHVNVFDLSILLTHYAGSGTGDIDGSGKVDVIDLSILLTNYGQ